MGGEAERVEVRTDAEVGAPAHVVAADDFHALALWGEDGPTEGKPNAGEPSPGKSNGGEVSAGGEALGATAASLWPRRTAPLGFADDAAWREVLARRHHLGALAVEGATMTLDDAGRPVAVALRRLGAAWARGFVAGRRSPSVVPEARGVNVHFAARGARVVVYERFALPCPVDLGGGGAPGGRPAAGWLALTLDLARDGRIAAHFGASYLPSAYFYCNGHPCGRHLQARVTARERAATLTPTPEVPTGTTWRRLTTHAYVHAVRR